MKQSGVIFTAKKHKPLLAVLATIAITLSLLFFTFLRVGIPHQTAVAQSQNTAVSIQNMQFTPAQMTIAAGTTVIWTNNDSIPHTVTSDNGVWDSGTLMPGQSFSLTFSSPGTFAYHCNIHPFMHGIVQVAGTVSPTPTPTLTCIPRPACLDARPPCKIAQSNNMCPPSPIPMPTPFIYPTRTPMPPPYSTSLNRNSSQQNIHNLLPPMAPMSFPQSSMNIQSSGSTVNNNVNTQEQSQTENQVNNNNQSVNLNLNSAY